MLRVFLHDGDNLTWLGVCHWEGRLDRPIIAMQGEEILEVYRCGKLTRRNPQGQVIGEEDAVLLGPGQSPEHLADFDMVKEAEVQFA